MYFLMIVIEILKLHMNMIHILSSIQIKKYVLYFGL